MIWIVEVYGYMPERFEAPTKDKARYRAYLQFRDAVTRLTFRDFLARGVTVTRATDQGGPL